MTDAEITEKLAEFRGWTKESIKLVHNRNELLRKIVNDTGNRYIERFNILELRIKSEEGQLVKLCNWNPLENISDAWELVEKLKEDQVYMAYSLSYDRVLDKYKFAIREYEEILNWDYWPNEETHTRAICMSVLKVIKYKQ